MTYSVYTSCSLNYLPKARVLADSLRRHEPDARLTLLLNDIAPDWLDLDAEPFDRIWTPADLGYDRAWIFQHNVMELCTAVKGRALARLIAEEAADFHIYFDPDVCVYHPLAPISEYMQGASIGLVPHILTPEQSETGIRLTEMSVTEHGIYNLGHLILRPDRNGRAFADWWAARLDRYCFDDQDRGLFTDQRWVDLAPAIFDGVRVLRVPNLDVASWNLFGRTLRQTRAGKPYTFTVDGYPLITYHFSGTGPTGTHRRIRDIFDPGNGATAEIERLYEEAIAAHGQAEFEQIPCAYDLFEDGTPIAAEARKLYRRHADLQQAFADPYATPRDELCYLRWLQRNRPQAGQGLAIVPGRLARAFEDLFDEDYYLASNPEVAEDISAGRYQSALDHYCRVGSRLGLDPNAFFVTSFYLDQAGYHDGHRLRAGGREGTLLWHYLTVGLPNGIEPIEFFDSRWYLARNEDVMRAVRLGGVTSPLAHFLHHGSGEGRDPGPDFNSTQYLSCTPAAREIIERSETTGAFAALVRLGGVAGRVAA